PEADEVAALAVQAAPELHVAGAVDGPHPRGVAAARRTVAEAERPAPDAVGGDPVRLVAGGAAAQAAAPAQVSAAVVAAADPLGDRDGHPPKAAASVARIAAQAQSVAAD